MFTAKWRAAICTCCALAVCVLLAGSHLFAADNSLPGFGQVLSDAELTALPRYAFSDGRGLPEGSGTALEGALIYQEKCASCHGAQGQGGSALELVGERSLLATEYPDRGIAVYWPYAPPLFDYIRRAMPPDQPYSLSADKTYAVIAYVLQISGLIEAAQRVDAKWLAQIKLPNRDGFNSLVPHSLQHSGN